MCNPTDDSVPPPLPPLAHRRRPSRLLLLTTESFCYDEDCRRSVDKRDERPRRGEGPAPTKASTLLTLIFIVGFLVLMEMGIRRLLEHFQHLHPLLSVELNRSILARHLGVDVTGCLSVSIVALRNRHVVRDMIPGGITFRRSDSMPEAGYEARLFTYHPAAQQVLLFFLAYQAKNMYDSLVWNDGPVFLFHHLLSGLAAWGAMYPGCAHFYALFFMGISEVSTAVLCVLANFDDEHGVVGLGDAFPLARAAVGAAFAAAFLVCRSVLWPFATYYFLRDCRRAMSSSSSSSGGGGCDDERARSRRGWIRLFVFCCVGLSALQVVWLVQIVVTIKEELSKLWVA